MSGDPLKALFDSTRDLHERFGVQPSTPTQIPVFLEEVREFLQEVLREDFQPDNFAQEAVDIFVTVFGFFLERGVSYEELVKQIQTVIDKNNSKTHETHHVNENGKIARRKR